MKSTLNNRILAFITGLLVGAGIAYTLLLLLRPLFEALQR
ncbi:hypothetical protein Marky_1918 [Marinithermus hydrothermalis DSM 14884]|uniref:Uncharacterized protein n=1 Tax=Marinithermus hydrothermalis (strain DSM 14884 / JCM 11576 / T1) TaxID=869210 RepID=F2NKI8_MARHT|nr:hypothetical protein Marky_1918 [Marinithermus hydrothermalis DSM 14884]